MSPNIENISTADQARLYIDPMGDSTLFAGELTAFAEKQNNEFEYFAVQFPTASSQRSVKP